MEHWKKDLLCPVCGKEFKGTAKAMMCSSTCRTRLRRMLIAGQKPEFYLNSKARGQKLPKIEERLKSAPIAQLTYEEKMSFNDQINKQIEELKKAPPPAGMNIRLWWQRRDVLIEDLKNQLK